ncbi:MAG: flagellar motor switch protein FliM [Planctomycetota bacterium]
MSDEALDQNQVENLLKAMENVDPDAGGIKEEVDADGSDAPVAVAPKAPRKSKPKPTGKPFSPGVPAGARITAYDFKRPERVGKDQMRAMHSLHESIARNFGASISGMLRTMTEVKLLSVDQLTYSEFVFSLDNPSCFNVVRPDPLEGHWILDIAPSLAYAIIDRLLGGDPVPGDSIRRPLTEIETRLMCRIVDRFLDQIVPAWENIVSLEPRIDTTESNPQLVQIVPPNEVVILVGFEILLGKNRGMMNLCIPFNTIEKYNSKLSRNGWVGYGKSNPTEETRGRISQGLDSAPVDVVVTLARSRIRTEDLLDLSVGDVITTEQEVDSPLELSIQEVPKFHASAGAYRGKKAIRIESNIKPKRDLSVEDDDATADVMAQESPAKPAVDAASSATPATGDAA